MPVAAAGGVGDAADPVFPLFAAPGALLAPPFTAPLLFVAPLPPAVASPEPPAVGTPVLPAPVEPVLVLASCLLQAVREIAASMAAASIVCFMFFLSFTC